MGKEQVEHPVARERPVRAFRQAGGATGAQFGVIHLADVDAEMAAEGIGVSGAAQRPVAAGGQQFAHESRHFVHQAQMVKAKTVPFKQHELAPVLAPLFLATEDVRQLVNVARTLRQQDFHRVFGRGLQITAAGGERNQLRVGNAAGAQLRSIDFQHATRGEKGADGGEKLGAAGNELAHKFFHEKAAVRDGGGFTKEV